MKKILFIGMFVLIISNSFAQKSKMSCEEIKSGITDKKLFPKMSNGQRIIDPHIYKNNTYEIVIEDDFTYYVGEPLIKKIEKAIKKNNCKGIIIQKPQPRPQIKIIRD
ncbi:MAG: hypothetical protein ACK5IC_05985 [Moheibacter sp.]